MSQRIHGAGLRTQQRLNYNIVTSWLMAGIVEPEEMAIATQRLDKRVSETMETFLEKNVI
jgi:hypothetical protein